MEALYQSLKPLLTALAYRMLGSMTDAEDVVQEAFIALGEAPAGQIENAKSYLCRIVTNRCINRLRSGARQREVYVGPWLPEPVATDGPGDSNPLEGYVQKESISTAYLLLLHQLSWPERVVFLLREVLDYDYDEIASIVDKSSANCRQIFSRAKRSLGAVPVRHPAPAGEAAGLIERFAQALSNGNVSELLHLLAPESALVTDHGGRVRALGRPLVGAEPISSFLAEVLAQPSGGVNFTLREINGEPGIVASANGRPVAAITFQVSAGQISRILAVINPEKLNYLAGQLD